MTYVQTQYCLCPLVGIALLPGEQGWQGSKTVAAHVGNYPPYWTGTAFTKIPFLCATGRPVTHRLICCSRYVESGVIRWFKVSSQETVYHLQWLLSLINLIKIIFILKKNRARTNHNNWYGSSLERHKDQPTPNQGFSTP